MNDPLYALIVVFILQTILFLFVVYASHKERTDLYDRLMSRSLGEYKNETQEEQVNEEVVVDAGHIDLEEATIEEIEEAGRG